MVICDSWCGRGSYSNCCEWSGSNLSTIISFNVVPDGDYEYKYYINDKKVTRSKYMSSIAPYEKGLKYVDLSNSYPVKDSVMKNKLLK